MQGLIFVEFSEMVMDKFGLPLWNELVETVNPETGGAYTAGGRYEDAELLEFVGALSEKTGIAVNELVEAFGRHIFPALFSSVELPEEQQNCMRSFLFYVDSVIHKEVKRVYPDAYLPELTFSETDPNVLTLIYRSKRKLCVLTEGLLQGCADHYKERISIDHPTCMHKGHEACELIITFNS